MAVKPRRLKETSETEWVVVSSGFDPLTERGVEAVLSVANGHFGVRGALEEGNPASNAMVIVAGVYVPSSLPAGQTLLTIADPATLNVSIDGQPVNLMKVQSFEHMRELDMRRGVSKRLWAFVDAGGRLWRWESMRAASASDSDCYLYRLLLTLESGDPATVAISLPTEVILLAESQDAKTELISACNSQNPELLKATTRFKAGRTHVSDGSLSALVREGEPLSMESASHILGAGEPGESEPCDFERLLVDHERTWEERWRIADVMVEGDPRLQQALRFGAYHLLSSASVSEGRWSVAPRDLSGRAYHGHVFWDTEIFALPFLSVVWPEAARSCLRYRHRTLGGARHRARKYGYEGAMYAWESTDTGEDRTPEGAVLPDGTAIRVLNGEQENHISADVPYAVVQYWRATGDEAFMLDYGAEILLECARFWCSRVSPDGECCSIRGVIGPDEYHESVNDNAFTNAMARWVLLEAKSYVERLRESDPARARALLRRLGIKRGEPEDWEETALSIRGSTFFEDRVHEQFDGFMSLQTVDVKSYRQAGVPLDIAVGHDAVQKLRTCKQADVLMALWLLPELWTEASARRNFAYYEPITAHTSSLSPPAHALVAAWLREEEAFNTYLEEAMNVDLGSGFRHAAGGVRIGSLGGLWQAAVFGLSGLKVWADRLEFHPFLPATIEALSFSVRHGGHVVRVRISDDRRTEIRVEGEACRVRVNREERVVEPGVPQEFTFDPAITFWSVRDKEERRDG